MTLMTGTYEAFMAHARTLSGKYADLRLSEADTRSYLIDPVLRLLGYESVENLRREVPVPATKEFIDYELRVGGVPHVLIEAKALRHDVTDQHSAQCVQYAAVLGVRWCLITNGVEWLLYDAGAKGPLAKKRVATIKLDASEASCLQAWKVLSLFAREELERARPISSLLIERVVLDELEDAESSIIEAIRRTIQARFGEQVTSAEIVATARKLTRPGDALSSPVRSAKALDNPPKPAPAELPVEDGDEPDAPQRDDDAAGETGPANRATWALKAAPATLNLVDKIVEIINEKAESPRALTFNRYFIGLHDRTGPRNFVTFRPQREKLRMIVQVPDVAAWVGRWKGTDIDAAVNAGGVRVNILPEQFEKNRALLTEMLHQAVVEVQR